MYRRRLIFCIVALIALFGIFAGYRFYENRAKPIPATGVINKGLEARDRAFLRRTQSVSQLPREIAKRFPSLKSPVWTQTAEKGDSGTVDSVKVIALATNGVGFNATKLPEGKAYRLPLPEEKILLERDIISDREEVYRIFTTPENTPEFPSPNLDEFPIPFDVPIEEESPVPYPLIAKFLNKQDDDSLAEFADWIKSVGGAARAQSLLEAAGLSDSIRIETATVFRQ